MPEKTTNPAVLVKAAPLESLPSPSPSLAAPQGLDIGVWIGEKSKSSGVR